MCHFMVHGQTDARCRQETDVMPPASAADFIPTEMAASARKLIALPTVGVGSGRIVVPK